MSLLKTIDTQGLKILTWLLFGVAFLPLLYAPGVFFPFITTKVLFFRTVVEIALALFLLLLARGVILLNIHILKNKITWLPALLLLVSSLAAFFGIDPYHSFWSSFNRMDGVLTLLHTVVFFYLVLLVFKKEHWNRFFTLNVWVGTAVGLFALGQWLNIPGLVHTGVDRVEGTIGNAAFLASYLGMIFFLSLFIAQNNNSKKNLFLIFAGIQLLAIMLSGTRGAFLALILCGLIFLGARVRQGGVGGKRAKLILLGLALGAVIFIFFRGPLSERSIPVLSRLASISAEDSTTRSRYFIWQETLKLVPERPLLGVGMENFEYLYNRFYNPEVVNEEWFDRSHNVYVDQLAQNGLLGLGVYLTIVASLAVVIWRLFLKNNISGTIVLLFVFYFFQNLFVFDTISTAFVFMALYAYVLAKYYETDAPLYHLGNNKKFIAYGLGLASIVSGWWFNVLPLRANLALAEGYYYQVADVARSVASLNQGLSYNTFADMEYGYQAYTMFVNQIEYGKLSDEEILTSYNYAAPLLKKLIDTYPWNVRLQIYLGHLIDNLPPAAQAEGDYLISAMDRAMTLSPKRSQPYYLKANVYIRRGQINLSQAERIKEYNLAIATLEAYIKEVPKLAEPYFILANVLLSANQPQKAEEAFQAGLKNYIPFEVQAKRVTGYLMRQQRYQEAEKYLIDLVGSAPKTTVYQVDLVKLYWINGKKMEAKALLEDIQKKDPAALNDERELVQTVLGG